MKLHNSSMNRKLFCVNLAAQPGAGKSTTAAYVFADLKNRGCNVELITEYCKQLVYSARQSEMCNQIYLFAKQLKKMDDIARYGKVPLIITDSPLLLGLAYSVQLPYFFELDALVRKIHDGFRNFNVLIKRTKPYNPSGRNQTQDESDALANTIEAIFDERFDMVINGDEEGQKLLSERVFSLYQDLIHEDQEN